MHLIHLIESVDFYSLGLRDFQSGFVVLARNEEIRLGFWRREIKRNSGKSAKEN